MIASADDVVLGRLLGKGAFASVYAVNFSFVHDSSLGEQKEGDSEDELSQPGNRPQQQQQRCVIKKVRQSICTKQQKASAFDLREEAKVLRSLPEHEHIIRLVGTSPNLQEDVDDIDYSGRGGSSSFLILERLHYTLQERLSHWALKKARQVSNTKSKRPVLFRRKEHKKRQELALLQEQSGRVSACCVGLAKALGHLHQHSIIYRDLKPDNVGFDYDGSVKLFDFGLSKRIEQREETKEDNNDDWGSATTTPTSNKTTKLQGMIGTPRYLSPEVATEQVYSFPADVYSFAMITWEVCTLEKPYVKCITLEALVEAIGPANERPSTDKIASPELQQLLSRCWDANPDTRPTFAQVQRELESILG